MELTQPKSKYLGNKDVNNYKETILKIFASLLVIFSGLILFSEKITTFGLTDTHGFKSVKTFIWMVTQTLAPILLCFGAFLKAYRFSFFIPLYVYFIQFFWVFNADKLVLDDPLLHIYALGFCSGSFLFLIFITFLIKQLGKTNQILLNNLKKATRFIVVEVSKKWIPKENKKEYVKEIIFFNESLEKLNRP